MDQPSDSAAWLRTVAGVAALDGVPEAATRLDAIAAELERTRRERDEARAALRPFAEAYQAAEEYRAQSHPDAEWFDAEVVIRRLGPCFIWAMELQDFARAAEIAAPEDKPE